MEIIFAPIVSSAIQTQVRMGAFDMLVQRQGVAVETSEVAELCVAEELLV